MFYRYNPITVWSSPEVLRSTNKMLEPQPPMDVYSFGIIMWEIFHEKVPFDNDQSECTRFVC